MIAVHQPLSRRWFWTCATIISIALCIYAYHFFPKAFPVVSLDLTMDRAQALEKARLLAKQHNWSPASYRQTALFDSDEETKNFIELEGGGQQMLSKIIQENQLALYSWIVRHFKEGLAQQTIIMFKPDGTPYGFQETVAQEYVGENLTQEEARAFAEKYAAQDWNILLASYQLIEEGQETTVSGRVDHTFTYERTDTKIGSAPYRLILGVSGDKLTKVKPFLRVPEGFKRRYQHMRSFNESLATGAYFLELIFYLLGGGIIGLFFLVRKRFVLFEPAFVWAVVIAGGLFIDKLNSLPLAWYQYPTALSEKTFLVNYIISALISFIIMCAQLCITFAAAESLSRLAFKDHIQFWKSWNTEVASSWQMLGRTVGGYLLVSFKLAFIFSFYFLTLTYLGWWMPTSSLIDPDILATYAPWYSSLIMSLMAGFREECFFRAIPLSIGMLLSKKYNNRGWIIGAFILQAIIFGAAHANYAAQPFYARLVELSISSCMFGAIFMMFGLMTVVICHYIYDVVWFAMPLFISEASGIWIARSCVLAGAAIPLIVVCCAYLYKKRWSQLASIWYNRAWQPPAHEQTEFPIAPITSLPTKAHALAITVVLGLLGAGWWGMTLMKHDQPFVPLTITRAQAYAHADTYLADKGNWKDHMILGDVENPLTQVPRPVLHNISERNELRSAPQNEHWFIWQTEGADRYKELQKTYLTSAHWKLRYVTFEGDVAERAHEQRVYLQDNGTIIRTREKLPEDAPGARISQAEAQAIAYQFLKETYQIDEHEAQLVSAHPSQKPQRTDWKFICNDTRERFAQNAQARITIKIAGDRIIDHYRWIKVPEESERTNAQERTVLNIIASLCALLAFLAVSLAAGLSLLAWAYKHNNIYAAFFVGVLLLIKTCIQVYNLAPSFMSHFHTSEPLYNQLLEVAISIIWNSIARIAPIALVAGFVSASTAHLQKKSSSLQLMLYGIMTGLCVYGVTLGAIFFGPHTKPVWPSFVHAGAQLPWLSLALTTLTTFISAMLVLQFLWIVLHTYTHGRTRAMVLFVVSVVLGLCIIDTISVMDITSWLWQGALVGCIIALRMPHDIRSVTIATGTFLSAHVLTTGLQRPYPGALWGALVSLLLIALVCYIWNSYYIDRNKHSIVER